MSLSHVCIALAFFLNFRYSCLKLGRFTYTQLHLAVARALLWLIIVGYWQSFMLNSLPSILCPSDVTLRIFVPWWNLLQKESNAEMRQTTRLGIRSLGKTTAGQKVPYILAHCTKMWLYQRCMFWNYYVALVALPYHGPQSCMPFVSMSQCPPLGASKVLLW